MNTALDRIIGFRLVTADLPRLVQFYRDTLGFIVDGPVRAIGGAEMALLKLTGSGRRQCMSLGEQTVSIDQFDKAGDPYPEQADAASRLFQHLALVVTDMRIAFARVAHAVPITKDGPQRLPPSSGAVTAYKFRDPDGHPLELLQFPEGGVPDAWAERTPGPGRIAIGIDHSAISVSDLECSRSFYAKLALEDGTRTHNTGREQQSLDGISTADVDVLAMIPHCGTPHLELLAYQASHRKQPAPLRTNDIAATRIVWRGSRAGLLADPDGHWHQIET